MSTAQAKATNDVIVAKCPKCDRPLNNAGNGVLVCFWCNPDVKIEWEFAVVGCNAHNVPRYLGFFQDCEIAEKFAKNAEIVGWQRVAIFDAALNQIPRRAQ